MSVECFAFQSGFGGIRGGHALLSVLPIYGIRCANCSKIKVFGEYQVTYCYYIGNDANHNNHGCVPMVIPRDSILRYFTENSFKHLICLQSYKCCCSPIKKVMNWNGLLYAFNPNNEDNMNIILSCLKDETVSFFQGHFWGHIVNAVWSKYDIPIGKNLLTRLEKEINIFSNQLKKDTNICVDVISIIVSYCSEMVLMYETIIIIQNDAERLIPELLAISNCPADEFAGH
ncbi:MAG: hypothetical protein Harvfovirus6_16 [Harvfovirus sp.]|uniref:Uncharacterized protein n=1 Tax=Harvfovirus sp. TaxID=2487768 RepID=A0A3G5A0L6_9VIRU|nr:MAG: hypothetical protein Harvfovirus6_16 [Harvfovirus sp.]